MMIHKKMSPSHSATTSNVRASAVQDRNFVGESGSFGPRTDPEEMRHVSLTLFGTQSEEVRSWQQHEHPAEVRPSKGTNESSGMANLKGGSFDPLEQVQLDKKDWKDAFKVLHKR